MKLYHGSNMEVDKPRLIPSKRLLDFGAGFYLTSDFEQAEKWAKRTAENRKSGYPTVSVFEFDECNYNNLNICVFKKAGIEWLRYISANRTGIQSTDKYDIVIGPVANDQTIRTVNNYLDGYLTEEMAIQLLLPQKLKDQYAFKTEVALSLLKFEEAKSI